MPTLVRLPVEILLRIVRYLPFRLQTQIDTLEHLRRPDLLSVARLRSVCRSLASALPVDVPAAQLARYVRAIRAEPSAVKKAWEKDPRMSDYHVKCYCSPPRPDISLPPPLPAPADLARFNPEAQDLYDQPHFYACPWHPSKHHPWSENVYNVKFGRVIVWKTNVLTAALRTGSLDVLRAFEKAGLWNDEKLPEVVPGATAVMAGSAVYRQEVVDMVGRVAKKFTDPLEWSYAWIDSCCIALKRRDFELAEYFAVLALNTPPATAPSKFDIMTKWWHLDPLSIHVYRSGWERGHELFWDTMLAEHNRPLMDPDPEIIAIVQSPFFGLGQGGHVAMATKLLAEGSWEDHYLMAGIAGAAISGSVEMIDLCAHPSLINARPPYMMVGHRFSDMASDYTPLEMACMCGQVNAIERLLAFRGIQISVGNEHPENFGDQGTVTALSLAAWAGRIDIVRLLLAHGADPRVHQQPALWTACEYGQYAIADLLLAAGCDINHIEAKTKCTLLDWACGVHTWELKLPTIHYCRTRGAPVVREEALKELFHEEQNPYSPQWQWKEKAEALAKPRSPCEGPTVIVPFNMREQFPEVFEFIPRELYPIFDEASV
ncbi:hypothetical protein HDU88_000001 [Geranomyces variabilis]|nr:hypothetical protein HDU88_000001 [Geranomyces variabilis]